MADEPKMDELDKLISMGKQKGFLTYDEVNDALPSDIISLDQLDDIMMMFGAMDIEVVDSAKGGGRLPSEIAEERAEEAEEAAEHGEIDLTPGPVGRTEDPVRLYLREMGRVSLLTREGEISLAKRIEDGKEEVVKAILGTNLAIDKIHLLRARDKLVQQAKRMRARAGSKKKKADPPWKKIELQAQAKQDKVLATLRNLHLHPGRIELWVLDLKRLVEKIVRAEREIALWSDGKRPEPTAVDAFLDSLSDDDGEEGDRDL